MHCETSEPLLRDFTGERCSGRTSSLLATLFLVLVFAVPPARACGATITGQVRYEGPDVRARLIRMSADPKCEAMHSERVFDDSLRVGEDGRVADVFVSLKEAPAGTGPFSAPEEPARLTQSGCTYTPKVQGVMVKQNLDVVNDDATLHNVRCLARSNRPFNLGQPAKGTRRKFFTEPERAVKFKCDVHPWMSSYIFVMDHPFFAVTDTSGKFSIPDVPPGQYVLTAWQEKLGELEIPITVTDKGAVADFSFKTDDPP